MGTSSGQAAASGAGGRLLRRIGGAVAALTMVMPCLVGVVTGTASATTGDTYVLPPSRYVVPLSVMSSYYGSYRMHSIGKGARLYAADIFITQNPYHDMYGGGSFFGYDPTGAQESWTNVLYDFHLAPAAGGQPVTAWLTPGQAARDQLIVSLYGWGSPSLGTMWLTRSANGDLSGTIQLRGQARPYPISFRKLSSHP